MDSVFYKYRHKKRFPITYQFLELFAKSVDNNNRDAEVQELLLPVLSALGYKPPYDESFVVEVLEQLSEVQKVKSEMKKGKNGSKRSFGSEFIKWFARLDIEQILFLLSEYDFDKAGHLWASTPVLAVDRMMETKMEYEWQVASKDFEAVIFGMGGKIKGGASDGEKIHDAPKNAGEDSQRKSTLKGLGFYNG